MDAEDRRLIEQLRVAVEHRTVIGMALGILMERHHIGPDEAFGRLRQVSSLLNRKLYDIARELVDTGELPALPPSRGRKRSRPPGRNHPRHA